MDYNAFTAKKLNVAQWIPRIVERSSHFVSDCEICCSVRSHYTKEQSGRRLSEYHQGFIHIRKVQRSNPVVDSEQAHLQGNFHVVTISFALLMSLEF